MIFDKTFEPKINGATQRVRMIAEGSGLPPFLIVQAGPGFPLLHEAGKFQRRLNLEKDFRVCYWEQRGCGNVSRNDAANVTLQQQVDDLREVLHWLKKETGQATIVFGISLGATFSLQAAEHERDVKAIVAISPDAHTASSDASAAFFMQTHSVNANDKRLNEKLMKLGEPPYTDAAAFRLRARILSDLGAIEHGRKFGDLLKETLFNLIRTYGLLGTASAMRNMNLIQNQLLPQLVSLNMISNPPRLNVPVHYVFGEQDPLISVEIVQRLPVAIAAPKAAVTLVPDAGHMVHFDQPEIVRSIIMQACNET